MIFKIVDQPLKFDSNNIDEKNKKIIFSETSPYFIDEYYKKYFHPHARYFEIIKKNKILCYYGIIEHTNKKNKQKVGEAFWLMDTFANNVFSKEFFKRNKL